MDDFLGKKRDSGPILDLSKMTANSKEEFRQLFDRVPDYKMKPEKIKPEDIKIATNVKKMKFKTGKKDFKAMKEAYAFKDPTPDEMKALKISDLAAVPIDWKMLTSIRPKSKLDESFFSRMVELKKLEQKTEASDRKQLMKDPQIKRIKNKSGMIEYRPLNCPECCEDFCNGKACQQSPFDCFTRIPEKPVEPVTKVTTVDLGSVKGKKKGKKKKGRSKSRARSPNKKTQAKKSTKGRRKSRSKSPSKKNKTK